MVLLYTGQVSFRLNSYRPTDYHPKYYTHLADRAITVQAFRYLRKILAHPAIASLTISSNNDEANLGSIVHEYDINLILKISSRLQSRVSTLRGDEPDAV
jgi:choline dehydrogenase